MTVYQKLHQELGRAGEDPPDSELRRWIAEAIELHPDMVAEPGERPHEVLLYSTAEPPPGEDSEGVVVLNVRQTMDALRLLLREFRDASNPEA